MHDSVRSNLYTKLSGKLRLSSVAGNGLPERMRTTAFAFLGLTAALGLALVAIFAQLSFPVLSPAPAPGGPLKGGAVSAAVALDAGPAGRAAADGRSAGARDAVDTGGGRTAGGGGETRQAGAVVAPAPVPDPSGEPSGSGGVPSDSSPSSTPAPTPTPTSERPPSSTGQPSPASPPKPKPTPARPAAPEPEPAPAPGNSQSSAAAEHASERGIEASSKSSTAAVAPEPAPEESPGNGQGKALGHSK